MMHALLAAAAALAPPAAPGAAKAPLPVLIVEQDNTGVTASCRVRVPDGLVIADADGNGVIHAAADNIVIDMAGSVLRGAADGTPEGTFAGTGITIDGHTGVVLRNIAVHGYKVGVWARDAGGIVVSDADLSGNSRQRLGSTPQKEDPADWLFPHNNDHNEWAAEHGAALVIEDTDHATVRRVLVRRGQNGIILDRVHNSAVYDNDCSFLSGWGIALWRSSGNTITRNFLDFCVRGHSEGVYNRGQDSAGLLIFEQSSNNIIAENSITHGGDGVFGFAGRAALGEDAAAAAKAAAGAGEVAYDDATLAAAARAGCNNNIFASNDLSYASAHGLEMTFGFDNVIIGNRFVGDGICGVWGGFSRDTLITGNHFEDCGGMAYGLERGGVNIEHAAGDLIIGNRFVNNRAGVHIWWDDPGSFASLPWAKANIHGMTGNAVADNSFVIDAVPASFFNVSPTERMVGVQFRNDGGDFGPVAMVHNTFDIDTTIGEAVRTSGIAPTSESGPVPGFVVPGFAVLGDTRPVTIVGGVPISTRTALEGRAQIVMDEWGPWDHESPMLREVSAGGGRAVYEVLGVESAEATTDSPGCRVTVRAGGVPRSMRVEVEADAGVTPYRVRITAGSFDTTVSGTLLRARWLCRAFSWADGPDPREDFENWAKLARAAGSRPFGVRELSLPFAMGGPVDLAQAGKIEDTSGRLADAAIGADHFGIEAVGRLRLPKGEWKIRTLSDDGVRVSVVTSSDQTRTVINNWTWHGPTADEGTFSVSQDNELVLIRVLHFEIDGYATLELGLERLP